MMDAMRVSVVTPSYNQARFIEETLASVQAQAHGDIEHIVIDGGSTDGSAQIIEKHRDHLAYWVSESDEGQTDALRKGFSVATGDIFCWLNSDDLFEPWTIREVVEFFEQHPEVEFVYGDATWIDGDGRTLKPKREHGFNRFVWMHDHNFIPQPSAFWRAGLYERVGGLDVSFDLAMDADLWIRFADVNPPAHVRRPWSRMRFYQEQKNTALRPQSLVEMQRIRERYPSTVPVPEPVLHNAARLARIGLKLAAGAYRPRELWRGLTGRFVGRSWEDATLNDVRDSGGGTSQVG